MTKPRSLVFRIRRQYFDQIVAGEKKIEYRRDSPFWKKAVGQPLGEPKYTAVFICGKRVHRRRIIAIEKRATPDYFSEQGKKDVDTPLCFAFHLGDEVHA